MSNPVLAFCAGMASNAASQYANPFSAIASYQGCHFLPVIRPDYGSLVSAFVSGYLDGDWFVDNAKYTGILHAFPESNISYTQTVDGVTALKPDYDVVRGTPNDKVLANFRPFPTFDEANRLYNRGLINPGLYGYIGDHYYPFNPDLKRAMSQLRFEIPGPSDLVRFAVRDCFSPAIVESFEYAKETPNEIKPWMNAQGYGQSIGLDLPTNATDAANEPIAGNATWFDLYWWSHWDLPSPTQGYEMLHRLYPESRFGPSPFFDGDNGFTSEQLSQLLKASDYPAFWRKRLEAISYHSLNRSDVFPMYRDGIVDRDTVYHALRSQGYRDDEAMQLLAFADYQKSRHIGIDINKQSKEWICKRYKSGFINEDQAMNLLAEIGIPESNARFFLRTCWEELKHDTAMSSIQLIRDAFFLGLFDSEQAKDQLRELGITEQRIALYLRRWILESSIKTKPASTRENLKAYSNGLIRKEELQARLQNLGYDSPSIALMVSNAEYAIANSFAKRIQRENLKQQRAIKAAQKEQLKTAKERIKEAKEKAKAARKREENRSRKLVKGATEANILAWYKKDLIKLWEVFYYLYHKDYNSKNAINWVKSKLPDIQERDLTNAEAQAKKVYNGEPNPPIDSPMP